MLLSDPATLADRERVAGAIGSTLASPFTLADGTQIELGASVGVNGMGCRRESTDVPAEADVLLYEVKRVRARFATPRATAACRRSRANPGPTVNVDSRRDSYTTTLLATITRARYCIGYTSSFWAALPDDCVMDYRSRELGSEPSASAFATGGGFLLALRDRVCWSRR